MFNVQNKYSENGCYKFLDCEAKVIYIGTSKDITLIHLEYVP